ncbi:nitroreductase family protein [Candidatus Woesearchaeota archaeon]|nr:nitroreductase family protein [Candidatus Woesearchaeota archaeon]MBW3005210.1 nitroreductase family protein [Candidatus Woesearchaeota archaeon]
METLEAIRLRRSIRKYMDVPVEFEKVGNILDAGRLAPNAGNVQDWRFILVTKEDSRKKIAEACVKQYWMQDAPVHIVVVGQPKKVATFYGEKGEKIYCRHNSAAAIENMLLAATDQGLGSCWVGAFEESMLRKALNIPADASPQAVITIGYAAEKPAMPQKFKTENIAFIEQYGNRIKDLAAFLGYYGEHVQSAIKKGKEMFRKVIENKKK